MASVVARRRMIRRSVLTNSAAAGSVLTWATEGTNRRAQRLVDAESSFFLYARHCVEEIQFAAQLGRPSRAQASRIRDVG